jgi:hypothetical protein
LEGIAGGLAMLWKLLRLQNLDRLWLPSLGQNFAHKMDELLAPAPRPARLRLYRKGRFH